LTAEFFRDCCNGLSAEVLINLGGISATLPFALKVPADCGHVALAKRFEQFALSYVQNLGVDLGHDLLQVRVAINALDEAFAAHAHVFGNEDQHATVFDERDRYISVLEFVRGQLACRPATLCLPKARRTLGLLVVFVAVKITDVHSLMLQWAGIALQPRHKSRLSANIA